MPTGAMIIALASPGAHGLIFLGFPLLLGEAPRRNMLIKVLPHST